MTAVVLVHGIGKQYEVAGTLHGPLANALRGGVEMAGGVAPDAGEIGIAFYGDLFRGDGARGAGAAPEADDSPIEAELALQWWRAAARIDPENVQSPDAATDVRGSVPHTVKAALRALSMSRFATRMTRHALFGELSQLRAYLYGDMREPVLDRVRELIDRDTRVVVGHSLGSIVAYEALCALPGHEVRALVTLGSPLGIRHLVFARLRPEPREGRGAWPGDEVRWTNICDRHDVVALEEHLCGLFGDDRRTVTDTPPADDTVTETAPPLLDLTVDNGWRAHDLGHYLTAKPTGGAIHRGLTR
ncbi:hypothetical protein [Streptomyces sp. NPDC051665]|uniref:hypothetical protein n=1 Tax=Streptomyces sp. NPDC051665 TaxID=3154647 RepID=UPI0034195C8E